MDLTIGANCPHKVWSWKNTGEFFKSDGSETVKDAGFDSGDLLILELNMDDNVMSCYKNDIPMYTFYEIDKEV